MYANYTCIKLFCMLYWTILLCMMYFNTLESSHLLYRPQLTNVTISILPIMLLSKLKKVTHCTQCYAHNYSNNATVDSSYATL